MTENTNIVPDICAICILYPIDICDIIELHWGREAALHPAPQMKWKGDLMATTKAQQRAVSKYMKENYDEIKVRVDKGRKDIIKAHAESNGESVNAFINRAIDEAMERE